MLGVSQLSDEMPNTDTGRKAVEFNLIIIENNCIYKRFFRDE